MPVAVIAGVGLTAFGRQPGLGVRDLAQAAAVAAVTDAGIPLDRVAAVVVGNATQGATEGQHGIRGQIALSGLGLSPGPVINVENACASGTTALHVALAYVLSGMADVVLAVGVEVMTQAPHPDLLAAFEGSWDVADREAALDRLADFSRGVPVPSDAVELPGRTVFMDVYAAFARDHMRRFGTTQRQFAAVSAKNHAHSMHNPYAQYRKAFSIDEVLCGKTVLWPLTVPMCSPISDGAAAVVVCSADLADPARAVRVLGTALGHGGGWDGVDPQRHVSHQTALRAYAEAGVDPRDVDVAEVHDATAVGEIQQVEHMGLVPYGDGGPAAERGVTTVGGRIPVNPSGGLESRGHPIGATGLAQVHELVTQLRGEAGARQVDGARIALAENSGGLVGLEEAAVAVTVLEAPSRRRS